MRGAEKPRDVEVSRIRSRRRTARAMDAEEC
jgi:hypothetical protein